jgi:hypothetical protein
MGLQRTGGTQRMDFETPVQTRKSVRGFTKEPVSRAVIEDIIEVAKRAPSSMNTQPWHIHVLPWAIPTTAFPPTPSAPTARQTAVSSALSASPTGGTA